MSSIDLFKQAENLKLACNDTTKGPNEVWKSRQLLQEIYQTLLTTDLEFALDKKVEQDLWKYTFKKQISSLQCQGKDNKQGNLRKGEVQAGLNLFLKAASGFYLQLLQELTCSWKMDTPFNKQPYCIGIIKEYPPIRTSKKFAHLNSYMYICQDCLVHLGDISRYRDLIDQAQFYYKHAARLAPFNGQPYNQLAILEVQRGNKLSAVFYHMRGLALIHPFPVSEVNLMKFFNKISKDSYESRQKLASNEWISFFLQFHATIFLNLDLNKSEIRLNKILSTFNNNLESTSGFSGLQLIQICAINFYQCYCLAKRVATKSNDKKNAFNITQSGDSKKVTDVTGRSGCETNITGRSGCETNITGRSGCETDVTGRTGCETDVTGRSGCQDHLVGYDGDESRTLKVLHSEDARGCSGNADGEVGSNRWGLEGEVEDMIDDSFVSDEVRNIPHHGDHLDSTAHKDRCVDARDVQYKKQLIMVTDLTVAILNQMLEKCCEAATTNEQNGCSEFNNFALETVFPSVKSCLEWLVINLEMLHDCTNLQTNLCWTLVCKLLNKLLAYRNIQRQRLSINSNGEHYRSIPLGEDYDLSHFLPLFKAQKNLDLFTRFPQMLSAEELSFVRVQRMLNAGIQLSKSLSKLSKVKDLIANSLQVGYSGSGHVVSFTTNAQSQAVPEQSTPFTTPTSAALPKVYSERRHTRTNVAMQAILSKTISRDCALQPADQSQETTSLALSSRSEAIENDLNASNHKTKSKKYLKVDFNN